MADDRWKPMVPPRPTVPPRPHTPVDEQAEIDRAIQLSLITAKQDDLRRVQLYGSNETISKTTMIGGDARKTTGIRTSTSNPNLCHIGNSPEERKSQTTIIARPRPQVARTHSRDRTGGPILDPPSSVTRSSTPPVIPPRPDSSLLHTTKPDTSPNQQSQPIPKVVPPRPSTVPLPAARTRSTPQPAVRSRPQGGATPESTNDQPLITLSPPVPKRKDMFDTTDFDIDSLDPLNEKYKPAPIPPTSSAKATSSSDTISTNLFQIGVRGPPSPVNEFAGSIAGMRPQSQTPPLPAIAGMRPQSQTPPLPASGMSQPQQTGSRISMHAMPPYPRNGPTAAPGGNLALPAPSGAEILSQLMPKPVRSPRAQRRIPERLTTAKDRDSLGQDGSGALDLMDFNNEEDDHEYLTLQSFDPLYAIKQIEEREAAEAVAAATERLDTAEIRLQLFPNPLDRFQRKETPNPFPAVNAVATQNILKRSSIQAIDPPFKHYHRLNTGDIDKGVKGQEVEVEGVKVQQRKQSEECVELQDPFSVSDLTVALERKRKKHSKEREAREARMKEEEKKKAEEKAARSKLLRKKKSTETAEGEGAVNPKRLSRGTSYLAKGQESSYETLQEAEDGADEEIRDFCQMVAKIKVRHHHADSVTNPGLVISRTIPHPKQFGLTVKVIVTSRFIVEPVVFTSDVNSAVQHIISHVLLSVTDDLGSTSTDEYILKVYGLSEYLNNESILANYEYVQQCIKLDDDLRFVLIDLPKLERPFLRTAEDIKQPVLVPKPREHEDKSMRVTREKLNILMETFYNEVEKLRDNAIKVGCQKVQCKSVIQAVKAICSLLCRMESVDIVKAVRRLRGITLGEPITSPGSPHDRDSFVFVSGDGSEGVFNVKDKESGRRVSQSYVQLDDLHIALEELTTAVKCMIELYCRTFHTEFRFQSATNVEKDTKEASEFPEALIVHVASAHRLPIHKWKTNFENFKVKSELFYGGTELARNVVTQTHPTVSEGCLDTILWDEWVQFEGVTLNNLPRETRLCFTLFGVRMMQSSSSDGPQKVNVPLGWANLQIYNHRFELVQDSQLLGLWAGDRADATGTSISNTDNPNSILLQINMPDFGCDIIFPSIPEPLPSAYQDFKMLHPDDQEQLQAILDRGANYRLNREQAEYMWEKRHFLYDKPEALAKVMQSVPGWNASQLLETYTMVKEWTPLAPVQAFELLLPSNPDTFVRTRAVSWLRDMASDEMIDYIPQLLQALKFESYHTSALAHFLLERCVASVRVAHFVYWLLKEAADDVHYRKRYQLIFGALLSVVGGRMQREFTKQEELVKMLAAAAEKVKKVNKDRETVLHNELEILNGSDFLHNSSVRLPIDPAMEVTGADIKSCSYFTSFTFPLRLVLKNIDPTAEPMYVMFKVGDDLRQDMLTMQLVKIMDTLWLQDNLDLKMVTFTCLPTGPKKGLVEIVTESDTLRKIQVKHGHGLAGSFKDRPIAEWLQIQNPTELEYKKAVDNFTSSCAGYCVATYVLGICDRHNDNIMIKQSGHLFHIDFAKFLGDSQMFGSIKRDRVPFVLTSDMAYVINGGDKPSHKFQEFVDLCCQAFNILRRNGDLLLNLFAMMSFSGIPGLGEGAAKYVQKALLPDHTDAEATAVFTRMIRDSMKSLFTQINFFFHNLAQMKFSGHSEGALLSFCPKTHSIQTDGKISNVEIFGYQKRYNPEKYYIYIIKVDRDKQRVPSFVFRRYSEFQELHHKLVIMFPLVRLPSLTNKVILGRTHIKAVAQNRKGELQVFLQELLKLAPEISEHDLIYTFFHPMLRDEQDIDKTNLQKLKEPSSPKEHRLVGNVSGQVKLAISYKTDTLTVMVIHVKDLATQTGEAPDPYVKLYLQPDPGKLTKKKTKITKSTFHPTYNEMLLYMMPYDDVIQRRLQVTVWNYNAATENEFLGAVNINLGEMDLNKQTTSWYTLHTLTNRHVVNT